MTSHYSRRLWLRAAAGASLPWSFPCLSPAAGSDAFSFLLLGDLHYDKLAHHDWDWLQQHHPSDRSQIENYSKLTANIMPAMFTAVREQIIRLRASSTPPAFVLQVGDLVEGLCGNESLAIQQNQQAVEFVRQAEFGIPFLFTKGNHDITGDGAETAFQQILLPFMREQSQRASSAPIDSRANHALTHRDSQFAFMDAYDASSLEWLEAISAKRTARDFFVILHPPVVPYGARATWHLYSDNKSLAKRAKLLELLGKNEAIVLGGHLHKFSALTRRVGSGRFHQLAVSSVVSSLDEVPRDPLKGWENYDGDQVLLEPKHSPETIEKRRAIYESERAEVTAFEYANSAGFAIVTVASDCISAAIHAGSAKEPYRSLRLRG